MATAPERAPVEEAVVDKEVSGVRPIPERPEGAPETREEGRDDKIVESAGFDDEARATYRELSPAEKGFVGKLFEKIKSTEVVQNLSDRADVWRNRRLAERVDDGLTQLDKERRAAEEVRHEMFARSKSSAKEMETVGSTLKELGIDLSEEELGRVKEESIQFSQKAEVADQRLEELEGRKKDLVADKEAFEGRVTAARERLDGRLAEKMDINTSSIELGRGQIRDIDAGLSANREAIASTDKKIKELTIMRGAIKSEVMRDILGGKIAVLEAERVAAEKPLKGMERLRARIEKDVKAFEKKNAALREGRNKIFPPKERKPAPEPVKVIANDLFVWENEPQLTADYGDGRRQAIIRDRIYMFEPDTDESKQSISIDDASDDQIEEFFGEEDWTADELRTARISERVVERIERIRSIKGVTVEQVIHNWNRFVNERTASKRHGLSIAVEGDPDRQFSDRLAAKGFLLDVLAKKVAADKTPRSLSKRMRGLVDNYFDSRR